MKTVLLLETYRGEGEQAWASVQFKFLPASGSVTINGDVYTFNTHFGGATTGQVAESLAGQINGDVALARFPLSAPHRLYYAQRDGNKVYVSASQPGTGGNAYTLSTSMGTTNVTLSGATFSGGS